MLLIFAYALNALINFGLGLLVAVLVGPAEFGAYALALAGAMIVQVIAFEWLRLAVVRFHQAGVMDGSKPRLDRAGLLIAAAFGAPGLLLLGLERALGLGLGLVGFVPLIAVANGLFDYRCGALRAEFDQVLFARTMIVKNLVLLVAAGGLILVFRSAESALLALILGSIAGIAASRPRWRLNSATTVLAGKSLSNLFGYSGPLVATSLMYLLLLFLARSAVALTHGLEEAGRFALALDFGSKVLLTIGSGLDLVLFPLAVRREAEAGLAAARARLSTNAVIVAGLIAPAAIGLWLILPSLEALFVASAYQGGFQQHLALLLPGLFAFMMVQYAFHPFMQIERQTVSLVAAAALALAATAVGLSFPWSAGPLAASMAVSAGLIAAAAALYFRIERAFSPTWPRRDLLIGSAGLAIMVLAAWPVRAFEPGVLTATLTIAAALASYCGCLVTRDVLGLRGALASAWPRRRKS